MEALKRVGFEEYVCNPCGYIYNPTDGDPDNFVFPGTPFERIHKEWSCPVCGSSQRDFELLNDKTLTELVFAH